MRKSVEVIDKQNAVNLVKGAKTSDNKSLEQFYLINGDKNTVKGLQFQQQREIQSFVGNKSVQIILWRNR